MDINKKNKFNVGEKVKIIDNNGAEEVFNNGEIGVITEIDNGTLPYRIEKLNKSDFSFFKDSEIARLTSNNKIKQPKFILQYEIDEDPIEEFDTLIAVKNRISELSKEGGHSFRVYKIEKMWIPIVEKKEVITIKGL